MSRHRLELALAALVVLLCVVAARRTRVAVAPVERPVALLPAAAGLPSRFDFEWLGAAAEAAVVNDPFRLANAPTSVRFSPAGAAAAAASLPPAPPTPRPVLSVRAIIGGPPWQAVVDGLGGQPGTVARAGDTFDKLVVARITADSVIVRAPDTTWKLTLKRERP